MSLEMRTPDGKLFGMVDTDDGAEDFVIINDKKVALSDVYSDDKLRKELNDEIVGEKSELGEDDA